MEETNEFNWLISLFRLPSHRHLTTPVYQTLVCTVVCISIPSSTYSDLDDFDDGGFDDTVTDNQQTTVVDMRANTQDQPHKDVEIARAASRQSLAGFKTCVCALYV